MSKVNKLVKILTQTIPFITPCSKLNNLRLFPLNFEHLTPFVRILNTFIEV